jgi:hypothetical protein
VAPTSTQFQYTPATIVTSSPIAIVRCASDTRVNACSS